MANVKSEWFKNCWMVAAHAGEIGDSIVARQICGQKLVLHRTAESGVVALEDKCPHRLVPLSLGRKVGDQVMCAYHGMRFGPDGVCTDIPGQKQIPAAACVPTFACHERYNLVWIWMGDQALADPALIPDLHWADSPDWTVTAGYLHFECDYRLCTDNLMDLSHESYIHKRTIGNVDDESIAEFPVKVTVEQDRLVRAHREMPNIVSPPMFSMILGEETRIHRWQSAIYMPPGIHMTNVGFHRVDRPRESAHMHMMLHLLTPETDGSTHYFWVFCRNYHRDDEELTQSVVRANVVTLQEDADILKIQQGVLDANPDAVVPKVGIGLDVAPVQARRLLHRLAAAEEADRTAIAPPVAMVADGPLSPTGGSLAA